MSRVCGTLAHHGAHRACGWSVRRVGSVGSVVSVTLTLTQNPALEQAALASYHLLEKTQPKELAKLRGTGLPALSAAAGGGPTPEVSATRHASFSAVLRMSFLRS